MLTLVICGGAVLSSEGGQVHKRQTHLSSGGGMQYLSRFLASGTRKLHNQKTSFQQNHSLMFKMG